MDRGIRHWQPRPLVISLVLAALLFITFMAPVTAPFWHVVDVHIAFALNGLVAGNHAQQLLWSLGNMHAFDFVIAAVMLALLLHYVARGTRATMSIRGAQTIVICVLLVVLVAITRELLFKHMHTESPSLVLQPFTRLSHHTSLDIKDASVVSFPGDHATVVATFVYLLWALAGWRYGLAALLIAIVACMPRLVAGAHWFSDDLVGGLGTALVTVPWVVFTPVAAWLVARLAPLLARLGYRVMAARGHESLHSAYRR